MSEESKPVRNIEGSSGFLPEIPRRTYSFPGIFDQAAKSKAGPRPQGPLVENCLAVGKGVRIKGTIETCQSLVVEGVVEASLEDCRSFELAETGVYSGNLVADIVDVKGVFEGTLVARDRLSVGATGRIKGVVRFNALEIETGGQIEGEMQPLSADGTEARAVKR